MAAAIPIRPCRRLSRVEFYPLRWRCINFRATAHHLSQGRDSDRFERFNIVVAILLAGWVPSILMLVVSYTILTNTLESKILRDRQTFVHLIAHLVGDDFSRTGSIIEYYQTQPDVAAILTSPNPDVAAAAMAEPDLLFASAD